MNKALVAAIEEGRCSGRMWLYSNYHCNLTCRYCLTESSPSVPKRMFSLSQLISLARQAKTIGFRAIGITGGEPFLHPNMVEALVEISTLLPVTVLSNGTLFQGRLLSQMDLLARPNIIVQLSLDAAEPIANDQFRGDRNFEKVVRAIPLLIEKGIHVRISSTMQQPSPIETERLRDYLASLGMASEDHIVREVVARGRAETESLGLQAPLEQLPPELTLSTAGAFYSPFGPTFLEGRLQTDLLLSRTIDPISTPVKLMLEVLEGTPSLDEHPSGFV